MVCKTGWLFAAYSKPSNSTTWPLHLACRKKSAHGGTWISARKLSFLCSDWLVLRASLLQQLYLYENYYGVSKTVWLLSGWTKMSLHMSSLLLQHPVSIKFLKVECTCCLPLWSCRILHIANTIVNHKVYVYYLYWVI
jgi:hypothetical protein